MGKVRKAMSGWGDCGNLEALKRALLQARPVGADQPAEFPLASKAVNSAFRFTPVHSASDCNVTGPSGLRQCEYRAWTRQCFLMFAATHPEPPSLADFGPQPDGGAARFGRGGLVGIGRSCQLPVSSEGGGGQRTTLLGAFRFVGGSLSAKPLCGQRLRASLRLGRLPRRVGLRTEPVHRLHRHVEGAALRAGECRQGVAALPRPRRPRLVPLQGRLRTGLHRPG